MWGVIMMLGNLWQSQKEAVMTFDQEFITKRRESKKLSKIGMPKAMAWAAGFGFQLP